MLVDHSQWTRCALVIPNLSRSGCHLLDMFFSFKHAPPPLEPLLKALLERMARVFCAVRAPLFIEIEFVYQTPLG